MNQLITEEGRKVDLEHPLQEHPNPELRRDAYASLNGFWDFSLSDSSDTASVNYDKKVVVPFAIETYLSQIQQTNIEGKYLHYKKVFDCPSSIDKEHVALHFEAVDCVCDVYLNGVHLGHHEGGYIPFHFSDLTLLEKGNVLLLVVKDDTDGRYPCGKQSKKPGGIWYTPTSGVWGSVWLENVPANHVKDLVYEFDEKAKICNVFLKSTGEKKRYSIEIYYQGELVQKADFVNGKARLDLSSNFHLWDVDHPNLYDVKVAGEEDTVYSYFGFRTISKVEVNGFLYPALNGKPIFLSGPLDQGYYPESGLTPPSDQAMIDDILRTKAFGFNVIRKHIKIEPRRWYYHCDRLGMLVMQDFMNIGAPYSQYLIVTGPFITRHWDDKKESAKRRLHGDDKFAQQQFLSCMEESVALLRRHPCIVAWTIFNEGWGQFDSENTYAKLIQLDASRLVDVNSGWIEQGIGDFYSRHIYFRKARLKNDHKRILSLSEFGGYTLQVMGHSMKEKQFGYKKNKDSKQLEEALIKLYKDQIIPLKKVGLAVAIYTQITDAEEEVNGLWTYDREVCKVEPSLLAELNKELKEV